jgi:ubiquinone/menaquinone biosynthesis C-methylase UbiE
MSMDAWGQQIQREVDRFLPCRPAGVRVLDAGGGKRVHIEVPAPRHVTVIDIDRSALALNRNADEKILGNIETHDFDDCEFDLVICWDVLEHVQAPPETARRLAGTVAPGGLMLIRGPLEISMKGVLARWTPFWVHVAFHRYFLGSKNAGKPGYAPFPLGESAAADDHDLAEALRRAGLEVVATTRFEGNHARKLRRNAYPVYAIYRAAGLVVGWFTKGRLGVKETDFFLLASRR